MLRVTRRLLNVYVPLTILIVALVLATGGSAYAAAGNGKGVGAAVAAAGSDDELSMEKAALPGQFNGQAPGLIVTIQKVKIPKDRRPVVLFTATDERGQTVGKLEFTEVRFVLSALEPGENGSTNRYVSYTTRIEDPNSGVSGDEEVQATFDAAQLTGVIQRSDGVFRYKFTTALPADYDKSLTHQLGGQFRRKFGATGVIYPANALNTFRPDGGTVTETRDIVSTESCNNCHTRLSVHGDIRREVQYCILCHTPQTTDANSGNTVDMPVMIHKIHMGEELPSVIGGTPYQIIGYGGSVNDYSTVAFPQDIRNCQVCHAQTGVAKSKAGSNDFHLQNPTMAGCASCHDRTWFNIDEETPAGYTDHPIGVALTDDSLCATCHTPSAPGVAPIDEIHMIPQNSDDAPGLKYHITSYSILNPSTTPQLQINFTVANGDDSPITDLNTNAAISVRGTIAWPVAEYTTRIQNTLKGTGSSGTLVNNGGGSYTYTFNDSNDTLPLGSTDTFAVAFESRRTFTHDSVTYNQGLEDNARILFTLDGSDPVDRRAVVNEENCLKCHSSIRAHGEQREGVEYCLFCHNTVTTDEARRPSNLTPATVNFKDMLHKIHSGEELENGITIYGFGNVANDFSEVRFPGLRQDCEICHDEGAYYLPLSEDALPTVIKKANVVVQTILPERAACMSCHDSVAADLHAVLNSDTVNGVESCDVCHGEGAEFSAEEVHNLTP